MEIKSILRSSQLDADLLDAELQTYFADHLAQLLLHDSWPSFKSRFDPEINAMLRLITSEWMLLTTGTTYGLKLHNMKYRSESHHTQTGRVGSTFDVPLSLSTRLAHAVLHVVCPYVVSRLNRHMAYDRWPDSPQPSWKFRLWKLMQRLEFCFKVASLINFVIFLSNGRYRSLVDRFLGMRVVYLNQPMTKLLNHDFMNRQLVWTAMTEFLVFIMPIINTASLKRLIKSPFTKSRSKYAALPASICVICFTGVSGATSVGNTVHLPFQTNCGHVYCYYCVKREMMRDPKFQCPRCNSTIDSIIPL